MDSKIKDAILFVHGYAPQISEWAVLKKEVLKSLPSEKRKLFSTRDPITKVANFNDLEVDVIKLWKELAGIDLYLGRQ
jgi:hypothetical protein